MNAAACTLRRKLGAESAHSAANGGHSGHSAWAGPRCRGTAGRQLGSRALSFSPSHRPLAACRVKKMAADRPCRCRRAVEQQLGPRARAATARSSACGRRAHGQQRQGAQRHATAAPPTDPPALLPLCVWASAAGSRSGLGHGASLYAHPPGTLVLAAAVLPSSLAHRRRFKGRQPPAALACLGPAERQTPLAFSCGSVRSQKRLSAHLDALEQTRSLVGRR
jgi:hypothetical protein